LDPGFTGDVTTYPPAGSHPFGNRDVD